MPEYTATLRFTTESDLDESLVDKIGHELEDCLSGCQSNTVALDLKSNTVEKLPANKSLRFTDIIKDWRISEVENVEHSDADEYELIIEQSHSGAIFINLYPRSVDIPENNEFCPQGLACIIEIRSGKPAISLGINENDLPLHFESDVHKGLYLHSDDLIDTRSTQFHSKSHGMAFDATYFPIGEDNWLEGTRFAIAEHAFAIHDFDGLVVSNSEGWVITGDFYKKTVCFDNPDGDTPLTGYFEIQFHPLSTMVKYSFHETPSITEQLELENHPDLAKDLVIKARAYPVGSAAQQEASNWLVYNASRIYNADLDKDDERLEEIVNQYTTSEMVSVCVSVLNMSDKLNNEQSLFDEYKVFCAINHLPYLSADELIIEDACNAEQRLYLRDFIQLWNKYV